MSFIIVIDILIPLLGAFIGFLKFKRKGALFGLIIGILIAIIIHLSSPS
jgi:hypothetical protein